MDDLLKPVKTVKKVQSNIGRFETLSRTENQNPQFQSGSSEKSIVEIVTSTDDLEAPNLPSESQRPVLTEFRQAPAKAVSNHKRHKKHDSTAFLQQSYLQKPAPNTLPDDAREILKSQPDDEDLLAVLQYLQYGIDGEHEFNIRAVNAKAAQIIGVLVTMTIPDQWARLSGEKLSHDDKQMRTILISCLTSSAGIGALLTQLKRMSVVHNTTTKDLALLEAVKVLSWVLSPSNIISLLLDDILSLKNNLAQKQALWQEICSLLGGSKVLATVSQAWANMQDTEKENKDSEWLGNGSQYSAWLAHRITFAAIDIKPNVHAQSWIMLSQLLRRGMSLGYRDHLVSEACSSLLLGKKALWTPLHLLLNGLSIAEQIHFFDAMLRDLAKKYLGSSSASKTGTSSTLDNQANIAGVAAIVRGIISGNKNLESHLVDWLTNTTGEQATLGLDTRRAVVATLASNEEKLQLLLDKCLENFSDKIAIQHMPILQQDALAQTILLLVGYLNRLDSKMIKSFSRSSFYLQSVSNRLSASVPRARILGMIVGVAVSRLVDAPDKAMKFDIEEMETEEVKGLLKLVRVEDQIGDLQVLKPASKQPNQARASKTPEFRSTPVSSHRPKAVMSSKIISIEEVQSDSDDEEDLVPYRKPDDDASDSEDDPTLINRTKTTAPAYILDLIKCLQMNDKPETVEMALHTAPSLIRRKTNFGTELSENIIPLASTLLNLQDGMSKEEGHNLRLNSMIACLVALPVSMGPWLSSMYFEGDFSISQRASLLTTVGLGTRELAGYKDDPKLGSGSSTFPSQRLPSHLESLYAPMESVARQIEHATLQPMALAAADKATGPDILKVRTFSSRMAVEKKTAQKAKERKTKIPKDLHKLLAQSFYLPLCCRMTLLLSAHTNVRHSTIFEPHIMKLFLQTLTILLSSLGPYALQLPTITRESLNLLLALHNNASLSLNPVILPPLLQLLLSCLQVNIEAGAMAEEHLVTDFGTMVAELVMWAGNIGNMISVPTGDGSDGMPWTVLAAGCQVKWHEVGQKFQGRMMGLVGSDFDNT